MKYQTSKISKIKKLIPLVALLVLCSFCPIYATTLEIKLPADSGYDITVMGNYLPQCNAATSQMQKICNANMRPITFNPVKIEQGKSQTITFSMPRTECKCNSWYFTPKIKSIFYGTNRGKVNPTCTMGQKFNADGVVTINMTGSTGTQLIYDCTWTFKD